jgi:dUTP pyrophosphatase
VILPTGVYIDQHYALLNENSVPVIQLCLRSSLAVKGLIIANGVGVIDADYTKEIGVIVYNSSDRIIEIAAGERIAQLLLTSVQRFVNIPVADQIRTGGFGSSGEK